jgi:hypothetical protein
VPWRVVEVSALGGHRLLVRFVDGTAGEVDAGPMILGPRAGVFERLRDPAEFARAYLDDGVVAWPGDLDLAPDAMYDAIRSSGRWVLSRH